MASSSSVKNRSQKIIWIQLTALSSALSKRIQIGPWLSTQSTARWVSSPMEFVTSWDPWWEADGGPGGVCVFDTKDRRWEQTWQCPIWASDTTEWFWCAHNLQFEWPHLHSPAGPWRHHYFSCLEWPRNGSLHCSCHHHSNKSSWPCFHGPLQCISIGSCICEWKRKWSVRDIHKEEKKKPQKTSIIIMYTVVSS